MKLTILAVLAVITLHPGNSAVSCWASNPEGTRQCAQYRSGVSNLVLRLCEDLPSDCSALGYKALGSRLPTRVVRHKVQAKSGPKPRPATVMVQPKSGLKHPVTDNSGGGWLLLIGFILVIGLIGRALGVNPVAALAAFLGGLFLGLITGPLWHHHHHEENRWQ